MKVDVCICFYHWCCDPVFRAIGHMLCSLFYPLFTFLLLAVVIAYWGVTAVYPFKLLFVVVLLFRVDEEMKNTTLNCFVFFNVLEEFKLLNWLKKWMCLWMNWMNSWGKDTLDRVCAGMMNRVGKFTLKAKVEVWSCILCSCVIKVHCIHEQINPIKTEEHTYYSLLVVLLCTQNCQFCYQLMMVSLNRTDQFLVHVQSAYLQNLQRDKLWLLETNVWPSCKFFSSSFVC